VNAVLVDRYEAVVIEHEQFDSVGVTIILLTLRVSRRGKGELVTVT
jgi:hypothetical protein